MTVSYILPCAAQNLDKLPEVRGSTGDFVDADAQSISRYTQTKLSVRDRSRRPLALHDRQKGRHRRDRRISSASNIRRRDRTTIDAYQSHLPARQPDGTPERIHKCTRRSSERKCDTLADEILRLLDWTVDRHDKSVIARSDEAGNRGDRQTLLDGGNHAGKLDETHVRRTSG